MHGRALCATPTDTAMWNYGSYNNRVPQLRANIKLFFNQWGIVVNP